MQVTLDRAARITPAGPAIWCDLPRQRITIPDIGRAICGGRLYQHKPAEHAFVVQYFDEDGECSGFSEFRYLKDE